MSNTKLPPDACANKKGASFNNMHNNAGNEMPKLSSMRLMMRWEFSKRERVSLSTAFAGNRRFSDVRADGKRFDRMALPRAIDDSRPTFRAGKRPRCEGATDVRYRSLSYPPLSLSLSLCQCCFSSALSPLSTDNNRPGYLLRRENI